MSVRSTRWLFPLFLGACAYPGRGPEQIEFESTADRSQQPAILYVPPHLPGDVRPLLVLLHSWSADYRQESFAKVCQAECERRRWILLRPDFRGPNRRPKACASDLAVQDVRDAVAVVKRTAPVDPRRVYLVGASGGGHMALVMAARSPHTFRAVSAWVPITDLAAWHRQVTNGRHARYAREMEQVCGGSPGTSKFVDAEYRHRSPLFFLATARGLPIDINAGIDDGHTGSVPISHTLRAFNVLARANGHAELELTGAQIQRMTRERVVPAALRYKGAPDRAYEHRVLFRRAAGPVRVTVFAGGHVGEMRAAVQWLAGVAGSNR